MFKIITKKEYNRLISSVNSYSEIVESQKKLLNTYKKRIEDKNILNLELREEIKNLSCDIEYNSDVIKNLKDTIKKKISFINNQSDALDDNTKSIEYLKSEINKLESTIAQLRKQLLILTPNRDAETGRFIPKYNSKKNEKKQV